MLIGLISLFRVGHVVGQFEDGLAEESLEQVYRETLCRAFHWRVFLGYPACTSPVPPEFHRILDIPLYPCIELYLAILQQIYCIPLYLTVSIAERRRGL